eukprot:CAMPEP_0173418090 /NCGR_PEP_ID=MMETSP1357-20121228/321_1 /TAXON_ID=77926 /ORGANISM="Hemiselmis rufescens, Strain PCC563" /LENGTH=58 /DNA_ID=CAMNT_0014380519 /DNA_START=35 /DNA_END=211 /DNA_ORIENTATION=-
MFTQAWNAASNDEIKYAPRPEHVAVGLRNANWMWANGSREVHGAVDTVEGRQHKASFD